MEKISFIWQILAMLGFWVPVKKSLPDSAYYDWVIVSAVEKGGFRPLPTVAEYSNFLKGWTFACDPDNPQYKYYRSCKVTHWHRLPRNKRKW